MAPVTATALGLAPQIIDDPKLIQLLGALNAFGIKPGNEPAKPPVDVDALVKEIEKYPTWRFEEQADLFEWIRPLNAIDASLSYLMNSFPALLLVSPVQRTVRHRPGVRREDTPARHAQSIEDVASVPQDVIHSICILLQFLSSLLRNSTNKAVFNSAEELVDLLAAADDTIASLALEALCNLSTPPALHKQQAPEVHPHSTALHSSKTSSHRRLIALARGWGSRGSGLGLFGCVTADDSEYGQGMLPLEAGELNFEFFTDAVDAEESKLVKIRLAAIDMIDDPLHLMDDAADGVDGNMETKKQKRRRMGSINMRTRARKTKATAQLFFDCLEQASGRDHIPQDRLFSLLADIRLARSYHSHDARVVAVECRLRALIAILHAHPSQEIMSGYFQAQPELCVELIDLLRPTVSSAAVSAAAAAMPREGPASGYAGDLHAISALANSPQIPYAVRSLAVEALTALVTRRDGASGGLTGVARQSNILSELGVGKGLYLGLLPTLIRYSLAALSAFLSTDERGTLARGKSDASARMDVELVGIDLGMAFLKATKPPAIPVQDQLQRALEFIDCVLTLTSAVVSAPSGTAALTECGLIPALLSVVSIDSQRTAKSIVSDNSSLDIEDVLQTRSLLRFITAQAIQIIEGAVATHNNALSAFHDLQGVDILVSRLNSEISEVRRSSGVVDEPAPSSLPESTPMDCDETDTKPVALLPQNYDTEMKPVQQDSSLRLLRSSQRVLLFSVVNCLTDVFRQESSSTSATVPPGGAQVRKPELTSTLKEIMEQVTSYGGVLAALTASLLSDVMNSDPHVVRHVHQSGLAESFLRLLKRPEQSTASEDPIPIVPAVSELIMSIPNVISALALTEDGATAIIEANPFPAILAVMYHPSYAMPNSRCMLNEMAVIVGTGMDEIMRHVPRLRPLVMSAIVDAMTSVVQIGKNLSLREEEAGSIARSGEAAASPLENDRTYLMQYALNFGQMLEHILQNEDHAEPFVAAGGLSTILEVFPLLMPTSVQFLAHASCLSCPSVCTLSHSTTEDSLTTAFKCIALHYDPLKMLKEITRNVRDHLNVVEADQRALTGAFPGTINESIRKDMSEGSSTDSLNVVGVLEGLPRAPLHAIVESHELVVQMNALSKYLRSVVTLQWLENLLSVAIRAACQRSQEIGTGWGRNEREWKKELSSSSFEELLHRLSLFHQSAILEVCRVRTEDGFEARDKARFASDPRGARRIRYRLRIVCQEGAVVRDGIEIDSCASVGSMEMGEIVEAFDRCVNSSGVLRYQTRRGWVSELTRGQGREPIAEVLSVWSASDNESSSLPSVENSKKRINCDIAGICSVGASVLARLQSSYSELFSSLSRVVVQGVKALPVRTVSFQQGSVGEHVAALVRILSSNIQHGFNLWPVPMIVQSSISGELASDLSVSINEAGVAMYLGSLMSHLHACLFEEKRERRMLNLPLLMCHLNADGHVNPGDSQNDTKHSLGFFGAVRFIFRHGLVDLSHRSSQSSLASADGKGPQRTRQSVSRTVAASLPPCIALLRRLMSSSLIGSSPLTSILSRLKLTELNAIIGNTVQNEGAGSIPDSETTEEQMFQPEQFTTTLHCAISEAMLEVWKDPRFICAPAHITHPVASLAGEIIVALDDSLKTSSTRSTQNIISESGQRSRFDVFSRRALTQSHRETQDLSNTADSDSPPTASLHSAEFEPGVIEQLMDMGFTRDHALDALESTESNRLEVAMEYALSHPPPSPASIERSRAAREERRRQREEAQGEATEQGTIPADGENEARDVPSGMPDAETAESLPTEEYMNAEPTESSIPARAAVDGGDATDVTTERVRRLLRSWIDHSSSVALDIICGRHEDSGSFLPSANEYVVLRVDDGKGEGDGELEGLTVVLCSFLLDICQRYPNERISIVSELLERLKSHIVHDEQNGEELFSVQAGRECSFSALCHAAVLFLRALPKTRALILQKGLIHRLVSCTQRFVSTQTCETCVWPVWLAPVLLLLDVMAQPMAAFTGDEALSVDVTDGEGDGSSLSANEEFAQVREERKKQGVDLAETARFLFAALNQATQDAEGQNDKKEGLSNNSHMFTANDEPSVDNGTLLNDGKHAQLVAIPSLQNPPFASVPPYFPLLPSDAAQICARLCLDIIGKGNEGSNERTPPPPGVLHAALLLLTRVLRSPDLATKCLYMGAPELILSLPRSCRFNGNSGLVTVVLRRLLEDVGTLEHSMETEIRGVVTRLHGKQNRQDSHDGRPSVPLRSFVQAVTPLICRNAVVFLKAAAITVSIKPKEASPSNKQARVLLLSPEERARNVAAIAAASKRQLDAHLHHSVDKTSLQHSNATVFDVQKHGISPQHDSTADPKLGGGKIAAVKSDADGGRHQKRGAKQVNCVKAVKTRPHSLNRYSVSKRGPPMKKANGKKNPPLNGTPSNHVMCLLIAKISDLCTPSIDELRSGSNEELLMQMSASSPDALGEQTSFLWLADLLEIMTDLVLAVPACAAAIHRYRPPTSKSRASTVIPIVQLRHALSGCPQPPKTFVSFLLHTVLPQDRWSFRWDQRMWERRKDEDDEIRIKRKDAHIRTKVAQTTARLLVALVARAGEGRRRVIADLAFALSGGRLGHGNTSPSSSWPGAAKSCDEYEFRALQAWGDLCIGLASPRSNGLNHDNNSSLSFEVVKIMLDFGMCHALMHAIRRVKLEHPMAATTCASLLVPLEVFTRGAVTDAVQAISARDGESKKKGVKNEESLDETTTPKKKKNVDATGLVQRDMTVGPSHRAEAAFADDAMLEDGFDAETAARNARSRQRSMVDIAYEEESDDEPVDDAIDEEGQSSESDGIDVEMEEIDDDGSEDDGESDDETSDSEGTDEIGDNSEVDTDEDDDQESEESDDIEIEEADDNDLDVDEVGGWDRDDFFDFTADEEEMETSGAVGHGESELDDGWTRIEQGGFGGMVLGRRNGRPSAGGTHLSARTRGFIDAAEAMIGTLLRTGEIQGDALAEIEGTLGIRILPQHRPPAELGNSGHGDSAWGIATGNGSLWEPSLEGARRTEWRPSDRSREGNIVGTLPHVHQRSPPDVGYTAIGGGGRWTEISSMEYVYGGPSIAAGSQNYDWATTTPDEIDNDSYPIPTQVDSQLFPGGPAASTHSRTQQALHPLLCGVDLPPVNALVSDLLPHGMRATRRGQISTRRPGEWSSSSFSSGGYLFSTSNGNIIRLNRGPTGGPLLDTSSRNNGSGLMGWTDDGLPFDGDVDGFSAAFERALADSAELLSSADTTHEQPDDVATTSDAQQSRDPHNGDEPMDSDVLIENPTSGSQLLTDGNAQIPEEGVSSLESHGQQAGTTENGTSMEEEDVSGETSNNVASDGDRVASSLAAGLRLSPHSESSIQSDDVSTHNVAPESVAEELAESGSNTIEIHSDENAPDLGTEQNIPNEHGMLCPPGIDIEVFNSLPIEMQREVVDQHEAAAAVAAQLDSASGLDAEALAALPEDMRREVIAQEQRERRLREQPPADPSNAEEMDNASFIASLAPDLREEILLTADDAFLNSLPPNIVAEAQILRERASMNHRSFHDDSLLAGPTIGEESNTQLNEARTRNQDGASAVTGSSSRRRQRSGKMKLECDRPHVLYLPTSGPNALSSPIGMSDVKALVRLMYLLSPVRPQRLLQKVFQNLSASYTIRSVVCTIFVKLLNDDGVGAVAVLQSLQAHDAGESHWFKKIDDELSDQEDFPPTNLIGAAPDVFETDSPNPNLTMFRRRQASSCAASIAANLPTSARGSRENHLPPVVATRIIDTLLHLSKNSPRVCLDALANEMMSSGSQSHNQYSSTCFDALLDLLDKPGYSKSSTNLEQLLSLIENIVSPLSQLPKDNEEEQEISKRDIEAAQVAGKEWVDVPRIAVSQARLQRLCSILRMESCRDAAFTKVNAIARRLCRVEANRGCILAELASVAQALGADAIRDLKALHIRMNEAVMLYQSRLAAHASPSDATDERGHGRLLEGGNPSSSVTLSTSTSELKLLRVLQTLQSLCGDTPQEENGAKKNEGNIVATEELVEILNNMNLDDLWTQLTSCLAVVKILEGVSGIEEIDEKSSANENDPDDASDANGSNGKKLQNSVAGLLTRFLPIIEAFFVVNASSRDTSLECTTKERMDENGSNSERKSSLETGTALALHVQSKKNDDVDLDPLVDGRRLIEFVTANRVLLNALVRNNPTLLEKGLRAMVQVAQCRSLLDFDVKRQWFKTQVRRLRQHASRRHGSLRLSIRRKHVFEDAYHQLRLRNADEMRGRLHITFRNEEGVDAGGLSREFFGILAKEIFNPNYALFTTTEDGCTFQPNPNSSINPDHLSYFRFLGRIVGKAVADGFLLDAHFTRSLYKHMLGLKPTHHDMEAIDPDYYKNLKMILEYNLADIGLDLTFSIEDYSFGRSQIIDLIPGGRNIQVTEDNKAEYVSLVCQHRMTTAIASQIRAYLDGFYELVSPELIAIFTPRELELLISGLPDIDVHDLKQNTEYQGYKATDKEIQWFWNIMFSLSRSEKAAFLQFVTGSSKVPLAGFAELQGMRGVQKFSIHKAGGSSGALMSAHTCFNSLDLPVYNSEDEMREKLLYAISEGGGAFMFA